jgi:hypothetical protein
MNRLKAGFDNYCLYPLNLLPNEVLKWAKNKDAEGVPEVEWNFTICRYDRDI